MRREFQKKIWRSFFTYFIIALLSVVLNLIGYMAAVQVLQSEIEKNDQSMLKNIAMIGDQYFADIRSRAYALLSSSSTEIGDVNRSNRSDFVRGILQEMQQSDTLDSDGSGGTLYSVIFRESGGVIQNGLGICDASVAFKHGYASLYSSADLWIDNAFATPGANYKSVVSQNGDSNLVLNYYVPNLSRKTAVTAKPDLNYLKNVFLNADTKDDIYMLADSEGRILVSSAENITLDQDSVMSPGRDVTLAEGSYIKTMEKVQGADSLFYIKLTPNSQYLAKIKMVRIFFVLGYLLSLLLGGLVAFLFARRNVCRESLLRNETEKYKNAVMGEVFKRMILNESLPFDSGYIQELAYRITGDTFILVKFEIFRSDKEETTLDEEYISNMQSWLREQLNVSLRPQSLYAAIMERNILTVVGLGYQENYDSIKMALHRVCKVAKDEFEVDIFCIVSEKTENFFHLHRLYAQIEENNNNLFLCHNDNVLICKPVEKQNIAYIYTPEMKEKLIFLLQSGNQEAAAALMNALIEDGKRCSLLTGKLLISEIISTILTICPENEQNERLESMMREFSDFYSTSGYFKLRKAMSGYMGDICLAVSADSKKSETSDKCTDIMEYIRDNYADTSINVNVLANRFHVDRSWLSKKFKEQYSENISDFIVKYRVEKAKELLKTDLSVEQIAERVGFADRSTYYRAFRKIEHITSKQYRELLKGKQTNSSSEDGSEDSSQSGRTDNE